jgi:L-alanine-DL-glutamate epimerase-like enolase superfamily enzyme
MKLEIGIHRWPLREPFTISRETITTADGVVVALSDGTSVGRGEAYGISYEGETPEGIVAELEALRTRIEAGVTRQELQALLPHGGARCALDCALWDLDAKRAGVPVNALAGFPAPKACETAFTIGIRPPDAVRQAARAHAHHALLKLKVNREDPLALVRAAREGAPDSRFIVDPNQSWTFSDIQRLSPELAELGVVLLEQPLAIGDDEDLDGWSGPVPICADELVHDRADLYRALGKYSHINIKLDKSGGLTEGLALAHAALDQGFRLMVGCMAGSSLAMAPAHLVAQLCEFVDLDGPLLQAEDWPTPITYAEGRILPPPQALWG